MASTNAHPVIIVTYKKDTPKEVVQKHVDDIIAAGGEIEYDWFSKPSVIYGYSAHIPPSYAQELTSLSLLNDSPINSIEGNSIVHIQ